MKEYLKVEKVLDPIECQSDNGNNWEKQAVVFSTLASTPVMLAIDFMGERKTAITKKLRIGQICHVAYQARSREYGDRWLTYLDGISVTPLTMAETEQPAPAEAPAEKNTEQAADEPPY